MSDTLEPEAETIVQDDKSARKSAKTDSAENKANDSLNICAGNVSAGDGSLAAQLIKNCNIHVTNTQGEQVTEALAREYESQYLNCLMHDCAGLEWLKAIRFQDEHTPKISLDSIYTALLTNTHKEKNKKDRQAMDRDTQPLSVVEVLNREKWLVLTGDPGSGKSAFVNYMAVCLAGAVLNHESRNLKALTEPLPDEEGKPGEQSQSWEHGLLIPVRVILRDFATSEFFPDVEQQGNAQQLLDFIKQELTKKGCAEYYPILKAQLRQGNILVMFDGLDEVAQAGHKRERMIQCISALAGYFQHARVLVTCRPYAYEKNEWQLKGFSDSTLADFGPGQICRFVERWYAHCQEYDAASAQNRADQLKQVLLQRPTLATLVRRPLLLTLTAYLHANNHELPERRADLYEELLELLIDKWEAARFNTKNIDELLKNHQHSLASYLQVRRDDIRLVLERLAFEAHAGQTDLVGTADIPAKNLTEQLLSVAKKAQPRQTIEGALAIGEYLRDRVGILYQRGGESELDAVYSFPHRSFQEYLCACYFRREETRMFQGFTQAIDDDDWVALAGYLGRNDPDRWREVILLAGGIKSFKEPKLVWGLLESLFIDKAPEEASQWSVADAWGLRLAAEILAENLKHDELNRRRKSSLECIRHALPELLRSDKLKAVERVAAGKHLATIGDQREEIMTVDSMKFCYVPAGSFFLGSMEQIDSSWIDAKTGAGEHRMDKAYWLARYPVSVAQYQQFVAESSFVPEEADYKNEPANTPVVSISWDEAMAFCHWLTQRWQAKGWLPNGYQVSLPSEPEWEKAAKGGYRIPTGEPIIESVSAIIANDKLPAKAALPEQDNPDPQRSYPWNEESGPDQYKERMNFDINIGTVSTLGAYSGSASPYGCEDMSGNVWEWTRSLALDYPYPETAKKRKKREGPGSGTRALRGGAFSDDQGYARCAVRNLDDPGFRDGYFGFRVVLSPFL